MREKGSTQGQWLLSRSPSSRSHTIQSVPVCLWCLSRYYPFAGTQDIIYISHQSHAKVNPMSIWKNYIFSVPNDPSRINLKKWLEKRNDLKECHKQSAENKKDIWRQENKDLLHTDDLSKPEVNEWHLQLIKKKKKNYQPKVLHTQWKNISKLNAK